MKDKMAKMQEGTIIYHYFRVPASSAHEQINQDSEPLRQAIIIKE
jgi:hypothetical protein